MRCQVPIAVRMDCIRFLVPKLRTVMKELKLSAPVGKTGAESHHVEPKTGLEIKIDWISGSVPLANLFRLWKVYESANHDKFETMDYGTRHHLEHARSAKGAVLSWGLKRGKLKNEPLEEQDPNSRQVTIELSGDVLGGMQAERLKAMMESFQSLGFRASRLDVAVDDFDKTFSIASIERAALAGKFGGYLSFQSHKKGRRGVAPAGSVTFGNRGSQGAGKQTCIYDKEKESKGEVPSVRLEQRFYGERAAEAFESFCTVPIDGWAELGFALAVGELDFRRRDLDEEHFDRCPRIQWWSRFLGKRQGVKLALRRRIKSIQKTIDWHIKQVAPSLVFLRDAFAIFGKNFHYYLQCLLNSGEGRQNEFYKSMLQKLEAYGNEEVIRFPHRYAI